MEKLFKKIRKEVKNKIRQGESPQDVYEDISSEYLSDRKNDNRILHRYIARNIRCTVTPENRKEFSFSYHLYLISLWSAFFITIISKQHRIEALGINSLSSISLWGSFIFINLFAWIYLYFAIRSSRFNLSIAYWALFISGIDIVRLSMLFHVHWIETPFFAILRPIPSIFVFIFGIFYVLNCSNRFSENKKNGVITFFKTKKKYHLGQEKIESLKASLTKNEHEQ